MLPNSTVKKKRKKRIVRDVTTAFELIKLRFERALLKGFTDPEIMDVYTEEVGRNYKDRVDWGNVLELNEKGVFDED